MGSAKLSSANLTAAFKMRSSSPSGKTNLIFLLSILLFKLSNNDIILPPIIKHVWVIANQLVAIPDSLNSDLFLKMA